MGHPLGNWLPLAVLLTVGAFLLFLLLGAMRAKARERTSTLQAADQAMAPPAAEVPSALVGQVTLETASTQPAADEKVTAKVAPKRKRPTSPPATQSTPIHDVVDLLKKKDALLTAFLLGEILGPPVSAKNRRSSAGATVDHPSRADASNSSG